MPLTSMTGFARAQDVLETATGSLSLQVEARCVNGRSSDIKLRLPSGFEHLDKTIRTTFASVVRRGNANVTISLQRESTRVPRINAVVLDSLRQDLAQKAEAWGEAAPALTDLIRLPGVVEMADAASPETDQGDDEARDAFVISAVEQCATDLSKARQAEGQALHEVLSGLLADIASETEALAAHPDVKPEHQLHRLQGQLAKLLDDASQLEPQRLHQEAALLASKADIEEEIARMRAHISAAHDLLAANDPVGRKLDFLAQEFNRESNTICSKAGSIAITQHGLALKALIDQVKEQVQNVE